MDCYLTGREMTSPYTCGKNKADYTWEDIEKLIPDLTEEEKKSPFAKYYYEPMAELTEEMKKAAEAPLRSNQCYMPTEAGKIMLTGDTNYPENGYGVLENGVGYSSARIVQEGITDEMIRNYRENFAHTEDCRNLFYKTWCPGKHLIHFDDAIIEDFGWGFVLQDMNWNLFKMKEHLGISKEDIPKMDPKCIAIVGIGGTSVNVENHDDVHQTLMVQYTHETENGRILWVHYWDGIKVNPDGTIDVCPTVDRETMEENMKNMMLHAMMEAQNELKHMKEFWAESHK